MLGQLFLDELTELLHNISKDMDATLMLRHSTVNAGLADLSAVTLERTLRVSWPSMVQVEGATLNAYEIIRHEVRAQAAHIADQVLKSTLPGKLAVETVVPFLDLNLQTAKAMELEIPTKALHPAEIIIHAKKQE